MERPSRVNVQLCIIGNFEEGDLSCRSFADWRDIYKCSGHTGGGDALCTNEAVHIRGVVESETRARIKRDLRSPKVMEEIVRRVRAARRARKLNEQEASALIAKLRAEVENLGDASAAGALRGPPSIAARLAATEGELERLMAAQAEHSRVADITPLLGDLAARAAGEFENTLASGRCAAPARSVDGD